MRHLVEVGVVGGLGVGKGKRRGIRVFYIGEKWGDELVSVCIYVYV